MSERAIRWGLCGPNRKRRRLGTETSGVKIACEWNGDVANPLAVGKQLGTLRTLANLSRFVGSDFGRTVRGGPAENRCMN